MDGGGDLTRRAADPAALPWTFERLDALMDAAGMDALVATSKHAVRYLLGGHLFIFFSAMDAIGRSRYLPAFAYLKGRGPESAYFGNRMEAAEHAVAPFWTPLLRAEFWGAADTMAAVAAHLAAQGARRVGVEEAFLPVEGLRALERGLPGAALLDASPVLTELRAVKSAAELAHLRRATELIEASMRATVAALREGSTKAEAVERLRQEETGRGLHFEYCLVAMGAGHNRAASAQAWARGEPLSLDSGGNLHGYLGDIARMACLGPPDAELDDLLAEVEAVQQAAFAAVAPGRTGAEVVEAAEAALRRGPNAACNDFFAHGMGLTTHEAPYLMTDHPVAYEGVDAHRPLVPGMVLSVETTMAHPRRGFVKVEDSVAVTAEGAEVFGAPGRGWLAGA